MNKQISAAAALTKMTDRLISLQDELSDTQGAYEKARNRAAQSKLDLRAAQTGIRRLRAKLDRYQAFMEKHQQTSIMRAEEHKQAEAKKWAWLKDHPEDYIST